jgi:hypothetical protein
VLTKALEDELASTFLVGSVEKQNCHDSPVTPSARTR